MKDLLILILMVSCVANVVNKKPEKVNAGLIVVKSNMDYMRKTAVKANAVINDIGFQTELALINRFDYFTGNGKDVLKSLLNGKCVASTYKSRNPFSKAIATTYRTDKTTFYMNTRKNPRAMKYMVNTFIHECLHILGYSHGDNSRIGKENTVNYGVGSLAEKYVK